MTTVLIIIAVIAVGFIIFKLESKPKKLNTPEAPEKIEPIVLEVKKKAAVKKAAKSGVTTGAKKTINK
jgi:hypothetical protein